MIKTDEKNGLKALTLFRNVLIGSTVGLWEGVIGGNSLENLLLDGGLTIAITAPALNIINRNNKFYERIGLKEAGQIYVSYLGACYAFKLFC